MTKSMTVESIVGQTINNKYHVDRVIGVGGTATVFAATHRNGKHLALKVLHPHIAPEPDVYRRFLREGYIANKVNHRGSVRMLDDDVTPEGLVFLVMDLLEGESFDSLIRRAPAGRLEVHEVLVVVDQLLDVLGAYHGVGIVHRDIKPADVFITRGGIVKVLDFGMARIRDACGFSTRPGTVLGSFVYMSPEQARGNAAEVDARADIYAVGGMMFHALTGRLFVPEGSMRERLGHILSRPAPPLRSYRPEVPDCVASLVDRALSFDRLGRWSSAEEMRRALLSACDTLHVLGRRGDSGVAPTGAGGVGLATGSSSPDGGGSSSPDGGAPSTSADTYVSERWVVGPLSEDDSAVTVVRKAAASELPTLDRIPPVQAEQLLPAGSLPALEALRPPVPIGVVATSSAKPVPRPVRRPKS